MFNYKDLYLKMFTKYCQWLSHGYFRMKSRCDKLIFHFKTPVWNWRNHQTLKIACLNTHGKPKLRDICFKICAFSQISLQEHKLVSNNSRKLGHSHYKFLLHLVLIFQIPSYWTSHRVTECCFLAAAGSAPAQHDQIHTVHNGMVKRGSYGSCCQKMALRHC